MSGTPRRAGELTAYGEQVERIRAEYPECLVLFRLAEYYEAYHQDAYTVAETLNLIVCGRELHYQSKERTPMASIPAFVVEQNILRLVQAGYYVAVAEAMGDPQRQKVERKVVRVVVPDQPCNPSARWQVAPPE